MNHAILHKSNQYFPGHSNNLTNTKSRKLPGYLSNQNIIVSKTHTNSKKEKSIYNVESSSKLKNIKQASPLIQYQYNCGKRKPHRKTEVLELRKTQRQLCSFHKNQWSKNDILPSRINSKQKQAQKEEIQFENIGKIRKNFKKECSSGALDQQPKIRDRFYSQPDLFIKRIRKQNAVPSQSLFGAVQDHNRNPEIGQSYMHHKNVGKSLKHLHSWKTADKQLGIQIVEQDDHLEINIKSKKIRQKNNEYLHRKSSSIKTRDSPSKNIHNRYSNKIQCQNIIDRERSKSVTVSTSTKDLQLCALLRSRQARIEKQQQLQSEAIETQYFFGGQNGVGRKFRDTILSEQAIVEQVKYLRNLALRLYSQRQQYLTKAQHRPPQPINIKQ